MNVLREKEKEMIARLRDPLYTVEFIEEWINRDDRVMINPVAAMQAVGAKAFLQAVRCMIRTHDWIPVSERLPEDGETVVVTVHSSEWISDYHSNWVPESEKKQHPESYGVYIGCINNGHWVFWDEEMSKISCCEKFGEDKDVIYDVVIAWMELPEPYKPKEVGQ